MDRGSSQEYVIHWQNPFLVDMYSHCVLTGIVKVFIYCDIWAFDIYGNATSPFGKIR